MVDTLARTDIEAIRARHRIEDVIAASGVELRRVGRQLMGHCPFHEDQTASMSVGGVADRYHCFGCGAGGDVIDYVRRLRGVGFRSAVAILDDQPAPPTISRSCERQPEEHQPPVAIAVERAWEINEMAWAYYTRPVHHEFALAHTRHRRGLDLVPAEACLGHPLLGRAGNDWTSLTRHLRDHGVTDTELTGLDLAMTGRHGLVDTYRERLVVPVTDGGHIIGLVGRDLSGRPRAPKYRNSTRTVVFDKSTMLYSPVRAMPDGGQVVIVEGPLDALAVTAAAITTDRHVTAVSTCGTTVTPAQVAAVLEHQPSRVTIALDGDAAGHTGTGRWVQEVRRHGGNPVCVADLPSGLDPAELIGRYGPGVLDVIVEQARPVRPVETPSAIRAGTDPAPSFDPPIAFTPPCWTGQVAPRTPATTRSRPL